MVLLYSRCINSSSPGGTDLRGKAYAGSMTCGSCHNDIYNSYLHTAHFLTSWSERYMQEKVAASADSFIFNENTTVAIEKRDSGMYQVAYINGKDSIAKRFEIGFGSGEKAISFGYWQDKRLYQLPLSYFTSIHGWANSPGFPIRRAYFQRPIIRRCFECHSSYIEEDMDQKESLSQVRKLDKNSIIYGIDCERCHGPAAKHVAFQTENPAVKEPRYITTWTSLSRQQKLDACGVCHSGNDLTTQKSTFSFKPGDTLSNFYYPEFSATFSGVPDVHGKQVQLLAASLCFQKSKVMECSSCHQTHAAKVPGIEDYSKQCIGCHKEPEHKDFNIKDSLNKAIINNCIDCHMPKQASKLISFQIMGKQQSDPYLLTTHRIAIYPEQTQKVIAQMKANNKK
jgi:predicted CXXCH cytochrome family protein